MRWRSLGGNAGLELEGDGPVLGNHGTGAQSVLLGMLIV